MTEIIQNLTNQEAGSETATIVMLNALAYVLMAVGAWLLGRRNDLGWWAYMLGVFAGPIVTALLYGYEGLLSAIPAMLIGVFGLWKWSKSAMVGRFGRAVPTRALKVRSVVTFVILVIVLTALNLGPMLTSGFAFSSGAEIILINMALMGIITASFAGIAFGQRWSFIALALAAAGVVALVVANDPALATLGAYVFLALGAIVGWFSWSTTEPTAVPNAQPTTGVAASESATEEVADSKN